MVPAALRYYPIGDGRGRVPVELKRMLLIYITQQCLGLLDECVEAAIYNS